MSKQKAFFYTLVGFAIVGLVYALIENPTGLMMNLLTTAVIIAVIGYLFLRFSGSGGNRSKDQRLFVKAAKQSRKRLKKRTSQPASLSKSKKQIPRKKSSAQLTVIEGKKQKKNQRNANF
ncbi:SA1362 family protein [Mangrovibacillus cuniculi]|uniref:Uncharacterized protein n=1 Tax=Mangrovibacillus cuniculi TaxID=2593652 RepID=A0A7S8CBB4_9BACI|nr:SA1362 family protein [Mangrovibacillus cuniculi]QPC46839.1 hypothetical protein G8O30_07625 [Mangrovibacillus cuniculi]